MGKLAKYAVVFSSTMLMFAPNAIAAAPEPAPIYPVSKYAKRTNPLLKVAKQKATVGIIPYYTIKGKTYIFLGQELTGGKKESSGTFSDFGGSVNPDGNNILHHALREFKEETMGQMQLHAEDVLKNGYLLYKKSTKGREIYYIFVKFTEKQYLKTKKFHIAKVRLKASGVPNSYLEKEDFIWVRLDDLLKQVTPVATTETKTIEAEPKPTETAKLKVENTIPDNQRVTVQTPDGESLNILIRGYFLRDCLQHQDLPALVKQLK